MNSCRFQCGKTLVYDPDIGNPPFKEVDTGIHHTFKRCAELIGSDASRRFEEYRKRKRERDQL